MGFVKHILQLLGLHRSWLTLLALGGAAAFFWWEFATMRAERDRYRQWADVVCASAGSPFAPAPKSKLKPGDQCKAEIAALARFRTDQARLTAELLARVSRERDGKIDRDLAAAARSARAAAQAAQDMEKTNAALQGDHVDPAWFAALNRLAGLQP
jgi:hypothetical protein